MATEEFLRKGIDCIEYKDGKRVNIASYVQMALRTAATRSYLQGEAKGRDELGIDTVLVSQYWSMLQYVFAVAGACVHRRCMGKLEWRTRGRPRQKPRRELVCAAFRSDQKRPLSPELQAHTIYLDCQSQHHAGADGQR